MPIFRGARELHRIEVESVDLSVLSTSSLTATMAAVDKTDTTSQQAPPPSSTSRPSVLPSQMSFSSGNPFVEVTRGILHLYKENKATPLSEEAERSDLICLLGVPVTMTTHDLIQFTAPVADDIENMRIIRDTNASNQYMVLIKFRNQKSADNFYKTYNGAAFNSIEPELCHVVFVQKVETMKEDDHRLTQPWAGMTELPTCPVCLEKMDESVEGILTILCNHSFHGDCLVKWGDTSCPVCRYCQTPEPLPQNSCFECSASNEPSAHMRSDDSLWICLICGHIGCGRYVEGHAYKHYCETQHTYAMQLGNNRVWDYAGDNYVHRLLQNKSDGKMVEVEGNRDSSRAADEKIDAVQLEYTYLLTNQLENQRRYFEDTMARMDKEANDRMRDLQEQNRTLLQERDDLLGQVSSLSKDKTNLEKKVTQMHQKLTKALQDLQEEKQLNKCLRDNQDLWQKKLSDTETKLTTYMATKDQEVDDLKEQVRDLMVYLEVQEKLKTVDGATKEEIEEASVEISPGTKPSSSRGIGKGRRKK